MDLHSGTPFWPVRDGLPAAYPALRRDESAEVAIVGAGVTGALIAYELSHAGVDVVVVERDEVASGSTAATSGLLLYDPDASFEALVASVGRDAAAQVYRLGMSAIDRIEALCRDLSHPCGFHRRPSLYLASRRRDLKALRRECESRNALGLEVQFFERDGIEARYSFSAPGAIYSQGCGEIDCYRFTHCLLEAAQRAGARIYDRTPVTALDSAAAGVTLTVDGGHHIRSRRAVWATGYDTGLKLERPTGRLASTWAFASEPLEHFTGWPDRCLIWETARPYLYVRTTDDGRLLAGGEDEPYPQRHRRVTKLLEKRNQLLRRTRAMFPQLAIEPAYAWAGTFATTEDGLPFIGAVPDYSGVWFALGYGGNGITFSVIAAAILRDAILGHENADATLFAFDRHR